MQDVKYLDKELKARYLLDFQSLLEGGDLDFGIDKYLIPINETEDFQTLFSKKYQFKDDLFALEPNSHIYLAYTKRSERELHTFLCNFANLFNKSKELVFISTDSVKDNIYTEMGFSKNYGYTKDPRYFDIEYYQVEIVTTNKEEHRAFFDQLTKGILRLAQILNEKRSHE